MSAQTGTQAPAGSASRLRRLLDDPNPIWIRELRQSARLVRTPIILCVLSILATLAIAAIGGLVSINESPATTGYVLFQVFFSLAYFVVTFVGPAVAANAIASEREGRTWEAVILTGLRPAVIARGKFLAAYTAISMYVVMLAPVGALPFLFGGVTATETIVAFLFLFLIAGLAVAFGLAVSSKMNSLRAALVVTLICAVIASLNVYGWFGAGLSVAAHHAWPGVPEGPPVWLPTAYARAPFDLTYVLCLIVLPIVATAIPAWFLYEVTIANLTSVTDDRSTGLKRWFLVAAPVSAICAGAPMAAVDPRDVDEIAVAGICALLVFLMFSVYLFLGDSLGPSRRVRLHWDRQGVRRFKRLLGPGILGTSMMQLGVGGAALGLVIGAGIIVQSVVRASHGGDLGDILLVGLYAAAFYLFSVGFGAFLRARSSTPLLSRVLLLAVHFLVAVGPWVVAAIAGIFASPSGRGALIVAAPSPLYVFVAIDAIGKTGEELLIVASVIASAAWGLFGILFLTLARSRVNRVIAAHEAALGESDRILAEEDAAAVRAMEEAAARAAAPAPAPAPEPEPEPEPQAG
ncbi:ABC transporter permease [Polyangium spumosum]|uniref:ABC transporter permease n=1 Tax=Polyangium spumosum TaxID=889282 RepID=A0A6N7Q0P4_9BACT|nr:ABC transporter permease [Polyangium spumosum]MRG95854.1 ABC transporter permease [Polyangium spumosum]